MTGSGWNNEYRFHKLDYSCKIAEQSNPIRCRYQFLRRHILQSTSPAAEKPVLQQFITNIAVNIYGYSRPTFRRVPTV
jgi:hypothetical protein